MDEKGFMLGQALKVKVIYRRGPRNPRYTHDGGRVCLPSHSTHLLQLLNVGLFGPLQKAYSTELDEWHRRGNNPVRKGNFHE